jgi:hypothetical protein
MAGAAVALPFVAWPAASRGRARLAAAAGAALVVGLVAGHLAGLPGFTPAVLLDFSAYRATPGLPAFSYTVPTHGLGELLADRARGLLVAFDPRSPHSYVASFGLAALAVVPFVVAHFAPRRARAAATVLRTPSYAAVGAALLMAVMLLAPVHLTHSAHWRPWLFGWRQGLPFLLVLVPAIGWTALSLRRHAPRLGSIATSVLVLAAAAQGLGAIARDRARPLAAEAERLSALGAWIDALEPRPTILALEPQPLAVHSRASFHWTSCWDAPAYVEMLLGRARVDLVLLRDDELGCASVAGLRDRLRPLGKAVGYTAYRLLGPGEPRDGPLPR